MAKRGIKVTLYEMKPEKKSDAHHLDGFAELVCSNSLKSDRLENAAGLLKAEMRILDSLVLKAADETAVPAGGALAVDRLKFSEAVTTAIASDPNITVINQEMTDVPDDGITVIATGPLTSDSLSDTIRKLVGQDHLSFYDAAAPIVTKDSIDMDVAFFASRYDKGGDDYLNCPMNKDEYTAFYQALVGAETVPLKSFENQTVFEACMPVETLARRGLDTLLFGPLKPVGLTDPGTGRRPHAVVQLRKEDAEGSMYNLVGFQTNLKHGEQKRVFSMIPGLQNAEFVRLGVMHRNTFINSPKILDERFRMKAHPNIYFAGQITGVEGYVESAASGLMAGMYAWSDITGNTIMSLDNTCALGALSQYVSQSLTNSFQPMHVNFAIINALNERIKQKQARNLKVSERALAYIEDFKRGLNAAEAENV